MPIDSPDVAVWRKYFSIQLIPRDFMFFQKFAQVTRLPSGALRALDAFVDRRMPALRRYGYEQHFVMRPLPGRPAAS